jgi:hypothetical protein
MAFGPESARVLRDLATRPSASAELAEAAGPFVEAALAAPANAVRDAMEELALALREADGEPLVVVANVVGYLVEQGGDPGSAADAFADRLVAAAASARVLADAVHRETADGGADDDSTDLEAFEEARRATASRHPDEARDWDVLAGFVGPSLAILAVSRPARESSQRCVPDLDALAPVHAAAHWIARFLRVLYDEPFIAIEPATRTAIRGRMTGISENFQFNVLLMDAFPKPGIFGRSRVSQSAAANARGDGPQETDEVVTGAWDMFAWTALQPDGSLPAAGQNEFMDHAIWNEGSPADIPVFETLRVVLLGPPSYARSWRAQRDFPRLRAGLNDVERLSKDVTVSWIDRLTEAAKDRQNPA